MVDVKIKLRVKYVRRKILKITADFGTKIKIFSFISNMNVDI